VSAQGLLAISPTDVWFAFQPSTTSLINVGIWNGSSFRIDQLPWLGTLKSSAPFAIDGTAPNDVWIVGIVQTPPQQTFPTTYDAHFNGSHLWTYLTQATQVAPVTVVDFRPNYALMIDTSSRVLEYNGVDRWHYVPSSIPLITDTPVANAHAVRGTTSFWAVFHPDIETSHAGFVQCPSNPY
jgi:hypothetical protein